MVEWWLLLLRSLEAGWLFLFLLYPKSTSPRTGKWQLFTTDNGKRGKLPHFMEKESDKRWPLKEEPPGTEGCVVSVLPLATPVALDKFFCRQSHPGSNRIQNWRSSSTQAFKEKKKSPQTVNWSICKMAEAREEWVLLLTFVVPKFRLLHCP